MNMKKILLIFVAFICCVNVAYGQGTVTVTANALGEGNDEAFSGGGTVQVAESFDLSGGGF
jgi:hypothetical protein